MSRADYTPEQRREWQQQRPPAKVIPKRDVAANRWDPSEWTPYQDARHRGNPPKYRFDPEHYDPADYAAFKEASTAWSKQQYEASKARLEKTKREFSEFIAEKAAGR